MYEGREMPENQIAVLSEPPNSIQITEIDGKAIPDYVTRVELRPGPYVVTTQFRKELTRGLPNGYMTCILSGPEWNSVVLQAKAGHRYSFYAEVGGRNDTELVSEKTVPASWYWDLPSGEGVAKWRPVLCDLESPDTAYEGDLWHFGLTHRSSQTSADIAVCKTLITEANRRMRHQNYLQAAVYYARAVAPDEPGLSEASTDQPTAEQWAELAIRLWSLRYADEAWKCLDRAMEIEPKSPEIWAVKGYMLLFTYGHYDEALECIDRVRDENNENEVHEFKSAVLYKLGRADEAEAMLEKARSHAGDAVPDAPPIEVRIDPPAGLPIAGAAPVWNTVPEPTPRTFSEWYARGSQRLQTGQFEEATTCFEIAIRLAAPADPAVSTAWYGKGYALYQQQDYDAALQCFNQALAMKPDSHMATCSKAQCLEKLGRSDEARRTFERAAELGSEPARGWLRAHSQPSP